MILGVYPHPQSRMLTLFLFIWYGFATFSPQRKKSFFFSVSYFFIFGLSYLNYSLKEQENYFFCIYRKKALVKQIRVTKSHTVIAFFCSAGMLKERNLTHSSILTNSHCWAAVFWQPATDWPRIDCWTKVHRVINICWSGTATYCYNFCWLASLKLTLRDGKKHCYKQIH